MGDELRFQVRFFHLGFSIRKPVRLFSVDGGQAREILYDPAMFDYGNSGLRNSDVPSNLGFAGFRLLFHTDWIRDFAAFQGASYFRAVDIDRQYGMSQRGLAIDCGASTPEEFPDFVAYYLAKPAQRLQRAHHLRTPRLAECGRRLSVRDRRQRAADDGRLTRRSTRASQIERLGIAPCTSMFLVGKNDRRVEVTHWRPEIHDSDGFCKIRERQR